MSRSKVGQARRDLAWLVHTWPTLLEARIPGTARYWIAGRAARKRATQAPDPDVSIHGKPAPLLLDVFDALVELNTWADDMSEQIARMLPVDRPQPASASPHGGWADPGDRLGFISTHLTAVERLEPKMAVKAADDVSQHAHRAAHLLGMITDGQVLDADCPYCAKPGVLRCFDTPDGPTIACTSGLCRADSSGHSVLFGNRAWRHADGGWGRLLRLLDEEGPVGKNGVSDGHARRFQAPQTCGALPIPDGV